MKHVGTIRMVVAREFQKLGVGSVLANELFLHALKSGLEKIVAEMMETQQGAKKVFEKLGLGRKRCCTGTCATRSASGTTSSY